MDRKYLKNMALKQSNHKSLGEIIFWSIFGFVFAGILFFFFALFIGLLSYGDWELFRSLWQNPEFKFALQFTIWTSVIAAMAAAITALPCAYVLARFKFVGRSFIDTLLDMPIILPPLISGIALLILFGPILGDFLTSIGIRVVFTPLGVIIAQWFVALPFAIKAFKQAFGAIDPRMEKIARTLGLSPFQVFCNVTLPMARAGLLSGCMMAWSRAMGEFGATAMLAGITRMKTETLSIAIFLNMSIGDMKFAVATSCVMMLVALIVLVCVKSCVKDEG